MDAGAHPRAHARSADTSRLSVTHALAPVFPMRPACVLLRPGVPLRGMLLQCRVHPEENARRDQKWITDRRTRMQSPTPPSSPLRLAPLQLAACLALPLHATPGDGRAGAAAASDAALHIVGTIYDDRDGNGIRDGDERSIDGVAVSNGRDVVRSGAGGHAGGRAGGVPRQATGLPRAAWPRRAAALLVAAWHGAGGGLAGSGVTAGRSADGGAGGVRGRRPAAAGGGRPRRHAAARRAGDGGSAGQVGARRGPLRA